MIRLSLGFERANPLLSHLQHPHDPKSLLTNSSTDYFNNLEQDGDLEIPKTEEEDNNSNNRFEENGDEVLLDEATENPDVENDQNTLKSTGKMK